MTARQIPFQGLIKSLQSSIYYMAKAAFVPPVLPLVQISVFFSPEVCWVGSWHRRWQHLPARKGPRRVSASCLSPLSPGPPTIFFLLINLLTPPHCVHCGGRWREGVQQVGKGTDNWTLELWSLRINYVLSQFWTTAPPPTKKGLSIF